jgi:hypothetical protein
MKIITNRSLFHINAPGNHNHDPTVVGKLAGGDTRQEEANK